MATRELKVVITGAVDGLKRAIRDVTGELGDFTTGASKMAQEFNKEFLVLGGAVAAGFGLAVKSAMDFDQEMSQVQAVSGATAEQMDMLRQAAIDAGAATVFSATDAAEAQSELAKAGVSTADILSGGLRGALDLASAGNLSLGDAATYAANAMNTFGLAGSDVPRIADTLAAGANKSAAEIDDMGQALAQSGLVADQMGLSLEDTVGVLSAFAQAGLKGSDAGTSFKTTLMRLVPESGKAKNMMEDLGLVFFDARGEFIGVADAAEELKKKLGPLSQEQQQMALKTIFGQDAIRGATILMEEGAEGVDKWIEAVSESGYAAQLAGVKTDNLSGDVEALRGSFETALIQGGSQATDALRTLTQGATDAVNAFSAMPEPIQNTLLGLLGVTGAASAGIGVWGTLAPKVEHFKDILSGMGGIAPAVAGNLGLIAGGASAILVPLGLLGMAWANHAAEIKENIGLEQDLARALAGTAESLEEGTDAWLRNQLITSDRGKRMADVLADTGVNIGLLTRGIRENGTELDSWRDAIANYDRSWSDLEPSIRSAAESGNVAAQVLVDLADSAGMSGGDLEQLIRDMDYYNDRVDGAVPRTEFYKDLLSDTGEVTGDLAGQTATAGAAFDTTAQEIDDAVNALKDWYDETTATLSANLGYEQSLDDISEAVKNNGTSLDINTQKGRDNIQSLIDAKNAIVDYGIEIFNATGSTEDATLATLSMRAGLEETMRQAGYTDEQVGYYLETLGLTPEDIQTQFATPNLAQSDADVADYSGVVDGVDRNVNTNVTVTGTSDSINKFNRLKNAAVNAILATRSGAQTPDTPEYAAGGIVDDGWFTVGEQGPELGFKSGSTVEIFSNPESKRMLASVGGGNTYAPTYNVVVNGAVSGDDVVDALKRYEQRNGTAWRN